MLVVFLSLEDVKIGSYLAGSTNDGEITTIGTHYQLGHTDYPSLYMLRVILMVQLLKIIKL
jgi:hypothetical protein